MAKQFKSPSHPQTHKPSAVYLLALRLFWRGESESALATIADALAEGQVSQPEVFYRLWIEILAQDQDDASLRALQEHLDRGLDYKHPSWISRYSLIGLIHYELGEVEASQLVLRAAKKHQRNPYYKELQCVLEAAAESERVLELSKQLARDAYDYLHLRRAALMAHSAGKPSAFAKICDGVETMFGKDPLRSEVGFHESFAQGNYRVAWQFAQQLREEFPLHVNYQFFYAYASYKTERNHLALEQFLQLNRRLDGSDPDVLCMISAALLDSGSHMQQSREEKLQIRRYLKRAVQRLAAMGLSAAYPLDILQKFQSPESGETPRLWMVKLSPRQCVDLYQRPLEKIEILHRAMGEYVGKHDICFFVSSSSTAQQQNSFRLVALYRSVSQPQWHPLHRWFNSLKLQLRMEVGIPFTLKELPKQEAGAQRYGLYQLDAKTLDILDESIKSFTLEDKAYNKLVAELKSAGSL